MVTIKNSQNVPIIVSKCVFSWTTHPPRGVLFLAKLISAFSTNNYLGLWHTHAHALVFYSSTYCGNTNVCLTFPPASCYISIDCLPTCKYRKLHTCQHLQRFSAPTKSKLTSQAASISSSCCALPMLLSSKPVTDTSSAPHTCITHGTEPPQTRAHARTHREILPSQSAYHSPPISLVFSLPLHTHVRESLSRSHQCRSALGE